MNYVFEVIPGTVLLAMVVVFPLVPSFALIALVIVALAAVVALVALAGAVVTMPYLVVRSLGRRLAGRNQSTEGPMPVAAAIPRAAGATNFMTREPSLIEIHTHLKEV